MRYVMNELEVIEWVRERSRAHSSLLLGVGDDMAIVAANESTILLSSDMLLDGVHFDSRVHTATEIGRKAVARALSDCAGMAIRPVAILLSVALPKTLENKAICELMDAMFAVAEEFGAAVAGGDTAKWTGPLAIDIAVSGEPFPGVVPAQRSCAKVDDVLYTTGRLGGSILGKHMHFRPRIAEARAIATRLGRDLHAMMDISDGLSLDLWRMCSASGMGALLDETMIRNAVSDDARTCSHRDGIPAIQHALMDGEDYELLIAVSPSVNVDGLGLLPLGQIVTSGLAIRRQDGRQEPLEPRGYVH